jgi:hypothetical protein
MIEGRGPCKGKEGMLWFTSGKGHYAWWQSIGIVIAGLLSSGENDITRLKHHLYTRNINIISIQFLIGII